MQPQKHQGDVDDIIMVAGDDILMVTVDDIVGNGKEQKNKKQEKQIQTKNSHLL